MEWRGEAVTCWLMALIAVKEKKIFFTTLFFIRTKQNKKKTP
jgi:hypothetical protein